MSPDELDNAINQLLEEQPNQEKPRCRRRNKIKDLEKSARKGTYTIPEKVLKEIKGEDIYENIEYFTFECIESENYAGIVNGWYDNIKEIARLCDVPNDWVRLEKIGSSEPLYWDGDSRVYTKTINYETRFYSANDRYLAYRGLMDIDGTLKKPGLLEAGYAYYFTEEMKEVLKEFYGNIPASKQISRSKLYDYRSDFENLLDNHVTGKYEKYRKLLQLRDDSNWYSKTEPLEKGNILGKHRDLIKVINTNARLGEDLLKNTDKYIMDFEDAHYKIVYDYYW